MSLESGGFIKDLVATNPEGTDPKSQGDDHMRLIKAVLKSQFSGLSQGKPILRTEDELNSMLLKGAYGLGAGAIAFTDANAAGGTFETGFYFLDVGAAANIPPGGAVGDTMIQVVVNDTLMTQLWQSVVTSLVSVRKWQAGAWSPWKPLGFGPNQTGPVDLTPGALLSVGAFGLGGRGEGQPATNLDAVQPCTQWIAIQPGMAGTIPPGGNPGDMCLSMCFNAQHVYQLYWSYSNGLLWQRQYNVGWNGWQVVTPMGVWQSWVNQTGSRALGATYTNNTNRAIQVSIGGTTAAVSGSGSLNVGGVIAHGVSWGSVSGNLPWSVSAVVPANAQYSMTLSAGSISFWSELR